MCDAEGLAKGVGEEVKEREEAARGGDEGDGGVLAQEEHEGAEVDSEEGDGDGLKTLEDDLKNPSLQTLDELRSLLSFAHPITTMNLVVYLRALIFILCLGRLDPLASAGGLPFGLKSLCSQSFYSKNWDLDVGSLQS